MPTTVPAIRRTAAPNTRRTVAAIVLSCRAALRTMRRWKARHRQRCDLGELDDRLLDDVGLTRAQAREERQKPPWR